jgi:hypothetical protein
MKKCAFIFMVTVMAVSSLATSVFSQQEKFDLQTVAFMAGCWEMKVPGRKLVITEQWMSPAGDAMLGMNRTLTDGKMSAFEYLRIVQKGDSLYYVALPSENDAPTSFQLKSAKKGNVIFENLGHDFPQTITYTVKGPNAMTAAVEGLGNERPKRRHIEFPMVRVKCS